MANRPKENSAERQVTGNSKSSAARPANLLLAASGGDLEAIRAALDAGVPIDSMIGGMADVFPAAQRMAEAMKTGGLKTAIALAMQANIAARSEPPSTEKNALPPELWGLTALMIAARNGQLDAARLLIERGADVMSRSSSTPLGQPPLFFAASEGHVAVMKMLLDAGADPSSTGKTPSGAPLPTPLFVAVDRGQTEAVRLLLERDARTDLKSFDISGVMTPLELAIRNNRSEIAAMLKQVSKD